MDSNFPKNTFSYRFFELDFASEIFSLKQLIYKELFKVLNLDRQYWTVNIWQQIAGDLSQKIVLSDSPNSFQGLVYSCAIAFPLANLTNSSPLSIAQQLVSLLPSVKERKATDTGLEIAVTVVKSGRIELKICDRNMIVWLNYLVSAIVKRSDRKPLHFDREEKLNRLFPLQYIYIRCASLLSLGAREGLISLNDNLQDLRWLIKQPLVIKWSNSQGDLCLVESQERDLLRQICLMLDYIAANEEYSLKHWQQFTEQISAVWLQFVARCGFCGKIKQQNPTLATARLGLIALTHWCLQKILSQFEFITSKNI